MGSCQSSNEQVIRAPIPGADSTQSNTLMSAGVEPTQGDQKPERQCADDKSAMTDSPSPEEKGQTTPPGSAPDDKASIGAGPPAPPPLPAVPPPPLNPASLSQKQKGASMKQLDDLMKMADEIEASILQAIKNNATKADAASKAGSPSQSEGVMRALSGDIDMTCPSPTKIVRIFTSSTFTDTKYERNMLMKHAYPRVKEHCQGLGYEFQVVDMRWGVRDEATDDHMGTELCLRELALCQQVSTGPIFVSLLSHKYGYTPFPRVIEAAEFETLMNGVEEKQSKELFHRWYKRDDNTVPPAYILTPISSRLPDFLSTEAEKKKQAKQTWWEESGKMQAAFDLTATKVFDKERARKYIMSVTEIEVTEGVLKSADPSKHTLWFKRNIEDIEKQPSSYLLSRFIECTGPEENVKKAREMLHELMEEKMARVLSPDRIINYSIPWNQASGVNPEDKQHKAYLDQLCTDFVGSMTAMIDSAVAEKARQDDALLSECHQHIRFCQTKCEGFQGRQDTLELIKQYVLGGSTEPLVLHGSSGTGKTSIMAMAAKMMKQWTPKPPAVLLRFLGTSPASSSLIPLLDSLTEQIRRLYKLPATRNITETLHLKQLKFKVALSKGRPDKPLILILDSLDQLDPAYDARKLGWLLTKLAPGTKVIVSTLPEPIFESYPALKAAIKTESNFISVPVLDTPDVTAILDNWLVTRQRCLTQHQKNTVLEAFKKCPTPLFLKLSFEEAATWTSFSPPDKTVLQDTVRASIDFLFQKLEKAHGQLLVCRALGYLTIANNGATETELEDILSCDDDVLNDVYMYWTPPIRRLPPLLLVRVRTDLSQYLVERGADGVRVIYWYHRQFIEAAEARYCSDEATNKLIHERLADFFNGTWADGKKKPYTSSNGEVGEEDRHVAMQPLKFGDKNYNMRSLNNLPFHRIKAGQVELLKDQCLANPNFLIHKLEAVPLYSVLSDYLMAKQAFPDDDLIQEVLQALHLSHKGLTTDPKQLIPQLLQRLEETDAVKQLLQRCRQHPVPYILPTKKVLVRPGGRLVHVIAAHKSDIDTLDLTADGKIAVTVCQTDNTVILWDVVEAKQKREVKGMGQCTKAVFCNKDQWLACETDKKVVIQDVESGRNVKVLAVIGSNTTFAAFGQGKTFIMQFMKQMLCVLTDLTETDQTKKMAFYHPKKLKFGASSNPAGSENYLAVCTDDQYYITVYDLKGREFKPHFRGFEKIPMEDDPGEYDEHEVEDLAIVPDETCLAYTTMFTSEVVLADFEGNKIRSIPGDSERSYRSINFTPDGAFLYIHDNKLLYIFNTKTLQEVGTLEQERGITMARSNDMVTVLTAAEDGSLCIWDRSRSETPKDEVAKTKCTTDLYQFKFAHNLNNPRYVLLGGSLKKNGETLRLEIYDVFKNATVKQGDMEGMGKHGVEVLSTTNDNQVIMILGKQQIVRLNLQAMKVVKNYIGFTTMAVLAKQTEEILCTTKGAMHVKLYDKNGDFVKVIKFGQKQRITEVKINTLGTIGCAVTDEGPLMMYDIKRRLHMYNIEPGLYGECFAMYLCINTTGTRLVFNTDAKLPGIPVPAMENVDHMVLWDIQNAKEMARLHDAEMQKVYKMTKADEDTNLEDIYELDDTRIISSHFDNILRVWNIEDGTLLTRLRGHSSSVNVSVSANSPYIFSYGSLEEEDCFKLWEKHTYQCVASFNLDKTVNRINWSRDGKFFVSSKTLNPPDLTMWKLHHGQDHMTVEENSYPETFKPDKGKADSITQISVKMFERKQLMVDGDPDTDPEEIHSDIDDDDDDDDDDDENDEEEE